MGEIWKDIPAQAGKYQVSNAGNVRRLYKSAIAPRLLRPFLTNHGYFAVSMFEKGRKKDWLVHRLVAEVYCENESAKPFVNHRDGVKTNNHFSNLEWCTNAENIQHAYNMGLNESARDRMSVLGRHNWKANQAKSAKARRIAVLLTRVDTGEVLEFDSIRQAAATTGTSHSNLSMVLSGKRKNANGYTAERRIKL